MTDSLREQVSWEQYDDPTLSWGNEGDKDSPYRLFLARHVLPFIGDVEGQSVLDVGCGTGWLVHLLGKEGAAELHGIEPSAYAKMAAKYYPEATFHQLAFEDFETNNRFDLITFIMSTEVMMDVGSSFRKCIDFLNPNGRVVLCKGNYDYFLADKYDYVLTREKIIDGTETIVKTERPNGYGTTIDIYRSINRILELAEQNGLVLQGRALPFAPDAEVIKAVPRYQDFANHPIMELMEFKKA